MAKQIINTGSSANKGDGDPLRTAFRKINENFDELYAGNFAAPTDTASHLIPSADATYNLGSADKAWADLHVSDFIYLNGARLEITGSGALLVNGTSANPVEVQDVQGSVFGDDSTTLVDAVNNVINLDGTISGDVIPDTDVAYDLGSATNRFRDLYLSGSTIDLGGTTLSIVGGNLQIGGTDIKDVVTAAGVDYSEIQNTPTIPTALSELTNDLDYAAIVGGAIQSNGLPVLPTQTLDISGSVFADDSSVMVDAINQTMFAETLTTLAVFGNPTLALNADSVVADAQSGNLVLQTTDTIVNNFVNAWEVNGTNGASLVLNDDGVTSSELSVNIDIVDFGTGNTIDLQNNTVLFDGATIRNFAPESILQSDTQTGLGTTDNAFQTTIVQDAMYTILNKVDTYYDESDNANTLTNRYFFGSSGIRWEADIVADPNAVGATFTIRNNTASGNLDIGGGHGNPVDGQRNGGDINIWAGATASGGVGGNVNINSNGGDIFIGPQGNTNAIKIGGGTPNNASPYAGGIPTTFYGPVDFNSQTITNSGFISLADLKTEVAASIDFADFQARIAAL